MNTRSEANDCRYLHDSLPSSFAVVFKWRCAARDTQGVDAESGEGRPGSDAHWRIHDGLLGDQGASRARPARDH